MHDGTNKYYDPEKRRTPWLRITFILLGFVVVILIILLFIKLFSKGPDLYSDLVSGSKTYLDNNTYPESIGECSTVTLNDLESSNLISNIKNYAKCDTTDTLVKVCKTSNDNYQYTPILSCGKKSTTFTDWKSGTIDDLKADNSEVSFKFVGEDLEKGVRTYYPDNLTDASKVSQYYTTSPNSEYTFKSDGEIAYKWYTEGVGKDYYNNGNYASIAPDGYTLNDSEKTNTYISLTKPNDASYRTVKSTTAYATEYVSYPYKFLCVDSKYAGTITSPTVCELRNSTTFKTTSKIYYTCDGTNEVAADTKCKARSNWTTSSCSNSNQTKSGTTSDGYNYTREVSTGMTCISTNGYLVSDKTWKWYKEVEQNNYYPSGSNDVNVENTYYVNTPVSGASKDESTATTAYKYYKLVATDDNTESWVSITDDSLDEDALIAKFQELGYNVSNLKDIQNSDKIRYQVEVMYRNRK